MNLLLQILLNIIFHLLGIAIIGAAIFIGFEVAHDEDRYIPVGITGCFFLLLAGAAILGLNFNKINNFDFGNLLLALLIAAIPATIGIILLLIWKKDK